jgi:hypothetical protein
MAILLDISGEGNPFLGATILSFIFYPFILGESGGDYEVPPRNEFR